MTKPKPNPDPLPTGTAIEGTVSSVLHQKGFGFINGRDGRSFFFHRRDAPDFETLRVGSTVSFFPVNSEKGWRADAVVVLEP